MNAPNSSFNRQSALREARAILRHHGKSYYYSTCLFPRELQDATCAVYAFVRLPDEIVDNSPQETPDDLRAVERQLQEFSDEWRRAYQTQNSTDQILQLTAQTWHKYGIPYDYSEDFLRAMLQDTHQTDYATYEDLRSYMYGSAAVIGLMMSHLVGFSRPETLEHAQKLGYAMQLTNFLRDIDEDFQLRNRVYMPADELARFNLSRADIETRNFSPDFRAFMQFQAARAHQLYEDANLGIPMLNAEGRFAVATASTLYRAILGKLEKADYNPFPRRVKTSMPEKIVLTGRAWKLSRA